MDQVIVIILVFIFLIMRAYNKPLKALQKQRQDQKTYPIFPPKREAFEAFHDGILTDKAKQDRQYMPARSSLLRHGEDSIDHDHWEALGVDTNYVERYDQPVLLEDIYDVSFLRTNMPDYTNYPVQNLLPEMMNRGIVRAVIMQEILGRPRSKLRKGK